MTSFFDGVDLEMDSMDPGLFLNPDSFEDTTSDIFSSHLDIDPFTTPIMTSPPPTEEHNQPISLITTEAQMASQRDRNERKQKFVISHFRDRPKSDPEIVNIVATINIHCSVDLTKIAQRARNSAYNPNRFKAVRLRLKEPPTTGFIFHTGKILIVGARSEYSAKLATRRVARIVQKIGYPNARWKEFKMVNLVAKADCGFRINLEGLALEHSKFASYEPELFPGCVYKMLQPKATLLIFHSGKVMVISKSKENLFGSFKTLYPALVGFRLQTVVIDQ